MRNTLVTVLLGGLVGVSVAGGPTELSDSELGQLISELGADEFQKRQAATRSLERAGGRAVSRLASVLGHENPEIRARALQILFSLAATTDAKASSSARAALREFQATAEKNTASRIEQQLKRLDELEESRASERRRQRARSGQMSEEEAISVLKSLGGEIEKHHSGGRRVGLGGEEWRGDDEDLLYLRLLNNVRRLDLSFSGISAGALVHLEGLPELEEINLHKGVTDSSLEHLKSLKNLRVLEFTNAFDFNGSGLKFVAGASELQQIDLYTTSTRGEYLRYLTDLPQLSSLTTSQTAMTDAGMPHISKMTSLKHLTVSNTTITDASLSFLVNLESLEGLDISENPCVTDEGLKHLNRLNGLRYLSIGNNNISDDCIPFLEGFSLLKRLSVDRSFISSRGLHRLKKAYPEVRISANQLWDRPNDAHWQAVRELAPLGGRVHSFVMDRRGTRTFLTQASFEYGWVGNGEDFVHLQDLVGLESLIIRTPIDDSAIQYLGQIASVEGVFLRSPEVEDHHVRFLQEIPEVQRLTLEGPFSDEVLPNLANVKPLRWLMFKGTRLTERGIVEAKRRFPVVRVVDTP